LKAAPQPSAENSTFYFRLFDIDVSPAITSELTLEWHETCLTTSVLSGTKYLKSLVV
jgi:hypothetical protein